eukprot:s2175_g12.t2
MLRPELLLVTCNTLLMLRPELLLGTCNTLLMLRPELLLVTCNTLLMLRPELLHVTCNRLLMQGPELLHVTCNTLLMLRLELLHVTCNRLLMLRPELLHVTCNALVLMLRPELLHVTCNRLVMLRSELLHATGNLLPNVRLKRFDYSLTIANDGSNHLRPPYPPRINRTIESRPQVGHKHKNPWPTREHKDYKLQWKNIEYVFVPELTRKPHGNPSRRWAGPVTRIEHVKNGNLCCNALVRFYDEILHDCAYVQHEIDRVRAEKAKTVDDRNKMEEVARATSDRLRADIRDALTMKADFETQIYKTKRRQQEQEEENARLRTYLSKCKEDLDRALR